jgi:hypothetical protein
MQHALTLRSLLIFFALEFLLVAAVLLLGHSWTLFLVLSGLLFGAVWIYDHRARMTPATLITIGVLGGWLCMTVALAGVIWQHYWHRPQGASSSSAPPEQEAISASGVELVPPKTRHEIIWEPAKQTGFLMDEEGKVKQDDPGRRPNFYLRALGDAPIQDATVEWKIDVANVLDVVEASQRLSALPLKIDNDNVIVDSPSGKRGYLYKPRRTATYKIDFISPNPPGAEAAIPIPVFESAILYIAALLPDGLGEELGPIPFLMTVTWTYPSVGKQSFRVNVTAKNIKPKNASAPLIDAVLHFSVEQEDDG